jgi:predicted permease
VGAQVALTLLMLAAAGAAGKGFMRLVNADLGYDPHQTMSVPIPVHENTYGTWKERSEYFEQIRATIAAMPQVSAAGISTNATPPSNGSDNRIEIAGRNQLDKPVVRMNFVSPEYFTALHIPLSQGRIWDHAETMRGARLVLINQAMAGQYWPNGDPIGKQFRIIGMKNEPPYSPGAEGWLQIVGVVADARNDGLRNAIKPAAYVPYSLKMRMFTQILVRTRVAPLSTLRNIRAKIVQIDRNQQVMRVRDLDQWITGLPEYGQQRFVATLFAIVSILALVLGAVGLYSVISYGVTTRTNEFGIPMALGAKGRDVVTIVVSAMLVNVGIGLMVGLVLSVMFGSVATKWVSESSRDPLLLGVVTMLLVVVAGLACLMPARRAALVDPMVALRYE